MTQLREEDIHQSFVIIDTINKKNIIAEYRGMDGYDTTSHKFGLCYTHPYLNIYQLFYPIICQPRFNLLPVDFPFDVISVITPTKKKFGMLCVP